MNSVFTFSHLFYRHLNLIHIFGGTDHWSQPLNMNSVFTFSHLFYRHLNFNSYFWRYGLLVSTPKYEFSIYIQSFTLLSFKF
jgi:hypothetical protein